MIKAVLSGGGTSEDDADAVDTGATVATTTRTATPIDTAIRVAPAKAPTRPTHLPYPIVISFPAAPPVDAWDIAQSERFSKLLAEA